MKRYLINNNSSLIKRINDFTINEQENNVEFKQPINNQNLFEKDQTDNLQNNIEHNLDQNHLKENEIYNIENNIQENEIHNIENIIEELEDSENEQLEENKDAENENLEDLENQQLEENEEVKNQQLEESKNSQINNPNTNEEKIQIEYYPRLIEGYTLATASQRQCITNEQAIEKKLMVKCSSCTGDRYYILSVDTIGHSNCKKENCPNKNNQKCYQFRPVCRLCVSEQGKKSYQKAKNDPNSVWMAGRKKRQEEFKVKMKTDLNFRRHQQFLYQRKYYRRNKLVQKIYEDWFKKYNLEYGQCIQCTRINPLIIECDHDESLMQEEGKTDNVCNIQNLEDKKREILKTQPLCCLCHYIKTYNSTDLVDNYTGKKKERYDLIQAAKKPGCVCCKLQNPSPLLYIYHPYFQLDHKKPKTQSDWFNKYSGFKQSSIPSTKALIDELKKCQCLCLECHKLKTYVEHPQRHSLTKHNWLKKYRPDFLIWYEEIYRDDAEMINYLNSERSKTDDFVGMLDNVLPNTNNLSTSVTNNL